MNYETAAMISAPNDDGHLTSLGEIAGQLPIDIQLSRLVIHGIVLDVAEYAVVLAAALSQPKTVFRIASPFIHKDPDEYNAIVQQVYSGMSFVDQGLYSEPLMLLHLYLLYNQFKPSASEQRTKFLLQLGVVPSRIRQFVSNVKSLLTSVNSCSRGNFERLDLDRLHINFAKNAELMLKLRLLLVWVSDYNVLQATMKAKKQNDTTNLNQIMIKSPIVTREILEPLFPTGATETEFTLTTVGKKTYDALLSFQRLQSPLMELLTALLSPVCEQYCSIACVMNDGVAAVANTNTGAISGSAKSKKNSNKNNNTSLVVDPSTIACSGLTGTISYVAFALITHVYINPTTDNSTSTHTNTNSKVSSSPLTTEEADAASLKDLYSIVQEHTLEQFGNKLQRISSSTNLTSPILTSSNNTHSDAHNNALIINNKTFYYEIYVLIDPTKKDIKKVQKLYEDLPKMTFLQIPSKGKSKLSINNVELRSDDYNTIFFSTGDASTNASLLSDSHLYNVTEKLVNCQQIVTFPNAVLDDEQSTASASGNGNEMNSSGKSKKGKTTKSKTSKTIPTASASAVIHDLPFAIRLFNSYRMGYKEKYVARCCIQHC